MRIIQYVFKESFTLSCGIKKKKIARATLTVLTGGVE